MLGAGGFWIFLRLDRRSPPALQVDVTGTPVGIPLTSICLPRLPPLPFRVKAP